MKEPPPPISFQRLFKVFQSIVKVKDIVRVTLIDSDKALFKSPINPQRRLEPLGFVQSTPKLKFLVVINDAERKSLALSLLRLRPVFSKSMEKLFITGELRVEPSIFKLKRALAPPDPLGPLSLPSWVPCAPSAPPAPLLPLQVNFVRASAFLRDFKVSCPVCNHSREFQGLPFKNRCWAQIWCTSCQSTFPSHRWHCRCGKSWRSCPLSHVAAICYVAC